MAREIKFRFYDEYLREMSYYTLDRLLNGEFHFMYLYENGTLKNSVHPMLYTGIKDKNGKDIYEGDILKDCLREVREVKFEVEDVSSCGCCYEPFMGTGFIAKDFGSWFEDSEVIGNIYENKELLDDKV